MAKSDRIVTRLEPEMRAKLHAKASALGLDDAAYVRMLIYRDANGADLNGASGSDLRPMDIGRGGVDRGTAAVPQKPIATVADAEEPEPLPVEEMEIPADADDGAPAETLEDMLAAAPSLLDEMLAQAGTGVTDEVLELARGPAPRIPQRGYRTQLNSRDRSLVALGGPGSRTRVLGVNEHVAGGNQFGDGPGNVLRDNMKHFGFAGTRSR